MQTIVAVGTTGFSMLSLDKFPAQANPYQYDIARMGTPIGTNIEIMYDHHDVNDYIVVVHKPSGKRVKIMMPSTISQIEPHPVDDVTDKYEPCIHQGKEMLNAQT